MRRLLRLMAITLAVACGDDPVGPNNANVSAQWGITFANMSGGGVSCSSNTGSMSLTVNGTTLTGSYGPLVLSCTTGAGAFQETLQGAIANGVVGINSVSFDLDTEDFHQMGNTNGCLPGECDVPSLPEDPTSMSGTAQWTMDVGAGQTATLNGLWSAFKQ
jgi:hypothetical protein